jgi:hypothetical protein
MTRLKCWTKYKTNWGIQWNHDKSDLIVMLGNKKKTEPYKGKYSVLHNMGLQHEPFKIRQDAIRYAEKIMEEHDTC